MLSGTAFQIVTEFQLSQSTFAHRLMAPISENRSVESGKLSKTMFPMWCNIEFFLTVSFTSGIFIR